VCLVLDAAMILLAFAILFVLLTGGGAFHAFGIPIRLRSVDNPLTELTVLLLARYALAAYAPFLGLRRLTLANPGARSLTRAARILAALERMPARRSWQALGALTAMAIAVKLACAWWLPGFFSGDDVEVHEMTFAKFFPAYGWPVWTIRNAFFPMTFIYPAERLAVTAGWTDPRVLVFAGRASVALLSSLAVPLTWIAARRAFPRERAVAFIAAGLVAVNKLSMSFGSSELPRPVAALFVIAAFAVLLRRSRIHVAAGGVLLGCAAAFRFSEAVFVLPAVLALGHERRWSHLAPLVAGFAASAAAIIAIADYLYWGTPFSSVVNAIDYTLVKRLSSRGYEPFYQYLRLLPSWSNVVVVALAAVGTHHAWRVGVWTWVPIVALSAFPHKESRYVIPVIPFLAMAAAHGIVRLIALAQARAGTSERARFAGGLILPLVILSVVQDAGGWRLARSNHAVGLAIHLRGKGGAGLAAEQMWRLGGRPYLHVFQPLVELDDERLRDESSRAAAFKDVEWIVVTVKTARRIPEAELARGGFDPYPWTDAEYAVFRRR
jgi:hypothetical protein